ncbi:NACHT domain-containing protein [Brevundimonas subvibrioides]|uniref:NACHT domain-containing protein n=1 Tax=Brevundimonas subvibrioides TaxID=74313 RepID=UPI0022B5C868|nr:hypothetical protein [Brevundimonas subvibrioides]
MTEAAGPSNQDGVFYQNTVAASHLADLLNLHRASPRESVIEVRVEALEHVDDIVVTYADRHREFIQAKSNLRASGDAWTSLWTDFAKQASDPGFRSDDRLVLALGRRGKLGEALQAMSERATATTEAEWDARCGIGVGTTLAAVRDALPAGANALDLFRLIEIRVSTLDDLGTDFHRLDLGTAAPLPNTLQSQLRDLVGGEARRRGMFRALSLRRQLADDFGADLFEPKDWGLGAYREALGRSQRIEIPGRGVSAPVDKVVVWPRARLQVASPQTDFDDETPRWDAQRSEGGVDLSAFPGEALQHCVLVAGPGFGKSTIVSALSARMLATPITPVQVSLGTFAEMDLSVVEFLDSQVNRDYSVRVDWLRLADRGLVCVLFDGLDEVPTASRAMIIRRIQQFSGRFPQTPWLLTVRDPAALNGPLEGQIVELEPFDNPEISKLVEIYKTWSPELDPWAFTNGLAAYPEVARLARIPLFLSIMLASWTPQSARPARRSDLIESYLANLFKAQSAKGRPLPELSDAELRRVSEFIAFDSLQREEIGLSDRQAARAIGAATAAPPDAVLTQLLACGVLRRGLDRRLQFPYPIVQEYLAAVHIVDERPDEVAGRIDDVVKRPWAQVIQFALELLPDPSPQIRAMLARPDDAFSTGLRLLGRCVANGAEVDPALRDAIGVRLADLWRHADHRIRERVGRLLVDAYSRPLHPEVRNRLGTRWLLGCGGVEIISAQADPALTLEVVDELLDSGLETFMGLRGLEPSLRVVGREVALRVAQRARRQGTTAEEFEGLTDFLDALEPLADPPAELVELALDPTMPEYVRLAVRAVLPEALDAAAISVAINALASDEWKEQSAAMTLLARATDIGAMLGDILTGTEAPPEAQTYLVEHLSTLVRDQQERGRIAGLVLQHAGLDQRHQDILRVYQLRAGDRTALEALVERIEHAPLDVVQAVLASLNSVPDRQLGKVALAKVRARCDPPSAAVGLAGAALFGMTKRLTMDGWNHYAMDDAPRHPAWDTWRPAFDAWIATVGLSTVERLRLCDAMIGIRPDLISDIEAIVLSATEPDGTEWDEDKGGHHLRGGMDELRRHRVAIPLSLAEAFVRAKRPNLIYAGVAAIGAHASQEALDLLLALHRTTRRGRSTLREEIEVVAARLGVVIMPEDMT